MIGRSVSSSMSSASSFLMYDLRQVAHAVILADLADVGGIILHLLLRRSQHADERASEIGDVQRLRLSSIRCARPVREISPRCLAMRARLWCSRSPSTPRQDGDLARRHRSTPGSRIGEARAAGLDARWPGAHGDERCVRSLSPFRAFVSGDPCKALDDSRALRRFRAVRRLRHMLTSKGQWIP